MHSNCKRRKKKKHTLCIDVQHKHKCLRHESMRVVAVMIAM